MIKIIALKLILISFLSVTMANCSAQSISFKYLNGKWTDSDKNDPISYYNFLSDSTLIVRFQNENRIVCYKLDSFQNEQRIIMSLIPGDTINNFINFIRKIDNNKMVLQDFRESQTGKWEKEKPSTTVYFVRQKENN
jgi:hypothetical protein